MSNYITTTSLNLRRQPQKLNNVICVMPPDMVVEEVQPQVQDGFREVRTVLNNLPVQGFASQRFLEATMLPLPQPEDPLVVPAVHYPPGNRAITRNGTGRIYPLNERGLVKVDLREIAVGDDKRKAIHDVIQFLDVERSLRYAPDSKNTYCNIYAYDVAYCVGAFLPRVWWTPDAIVKWQRNQQVPIQYEQTVLELTANYIADWLEKFGTVFGWQRMFDLTSFQTSVNEGRLGILVGQRINMGNPGHIVAVVPETNQHTARRGSNAMVLSPLQSQAGRTNRKYSAGNSWWLDTTRFRKFSFWIWP